MNLGLDAETVSHRVEEALAMVGIEHLRERVPHHLSGGEKKRVAIAGVIAMEPQVIVLDEPTAGLDPQGVKDLISVINALAREYGITVIFSTHDVSLVPEVADYLYVMHKGKIVAEGGVSDVFADPELLGSVRLDVPVIPKLIRLLREEGLDIGMAYTLEEAKTAFLKSYRERV
jgi:cobalt/nickel transport system ATP-binding protein